MKRKNIKNCSNFKSINCVDGIHNRPLGSCCSNCLYFSSKNCHLEAANQIEPDFDLI